MMVHRNIKVQFTMVLLYRDTLKNGLYIPSPPRQTVTTVDDSMVFLSALCIYINIKRT